MSKLQEKIIKEYDAIKLPSRCYNQDQVKQDGKIYHHFIRMNGYDNKRDEGWLFEQPEFQKNLKKKIAVALGYDCGFMKLDIFLA